MIADKQIAIRLKKLRDKMPPIDPTKNQGVLAINQHNRPILFTRTNVSIWIEYFEASGFQGDEFKLIVMRICNQLWEKVNA